MAVNFAREAEVIEPIRDGILFSFRLRHPSGWRDSVPETVEIDVTEKTKPGVVYVVIGSAQICDYKPGGTNIGSFLDSADVVESGGRRLLRLNYRTLIHEAGGPGKIYALQFLGSAVKKLPLP